MKSALIIEGDWHKCSEADMWSFGNEGYDTLEAVIGGESAYYVKQS